MQQIKDIFIGWSNSFIDNLPSIILALVFVILFAILAEIFKKISYKLLSRLSSNESVNRLLGTFIALTILFIGIMIALNILGLDTALTSLLAGAGILGVALGFAFQDLGANLIAGVTVAVQKPFNVGDLVKVDKYFGVVKNISLRITELETLQGETVYIPNKAIMASSIEDFTGLGYRRIDIKIGISYGDDMEKAKNIVLDVLKNVENTVHEKPIEVFFEKFDSYSVNMLAYFWIKFKNQPDYLKAKDDALINIKKAFNQNKITIPFPITTVDFGIKGGTRWDELNK